MPLDSLYTKQSIAGPGFGINITGTGAAPLLAVFLSFDPDVDRKEITKSILLNFTVSAVDSNGDDIVFRLLFAKASAVNIVGPGSTLDIVDSLVNDKTSILSLIDGLPTGLITSSAVNVGEVLQSAISTRIPLTPNIPYRWLDDIDGNLFPVLQFNFISTGAGNITNISLDIKFNEFET